MISIEQLKNKLIVSYFNDLGNIELETLELSEQDMFEWKLPKKISEDNKIFERSVLKKSKVNVLSKYRINEILQQYQLKNFNKNLPQKTFYFTIKLESLEEQTTLENLNAQVDLIIISNNLSHVYGLGTKEISDSNVDSIKENLSKLFKVEIKFKYIKYKDEYSLIYSFFVDYLKKISVITGWNFLSFQWQYLFKRAKKLGININSCTLTNHFQHNFIPYHKVVLDYLELYKNFDKTIKVKEDDSIEWIANEVLGLKLSKYNNYFHQHNFIEYLYFSVIENYIVKLLDDKFNLLRLFIKFSQISQTEITKAFSMINIVENLMSIELFKRNKVFVNHENHEKIKSYQGGSSINPKLGMYSNVVNFDYASFFSSITRQWNISPDTYLGKNVTEDCIKTINGCCFKKSETGVLKTILEDLYNKRLNVKKEIIDINSNIEQLEKQLLIT